MFENRSSEKLTIDRSRFDFRGIPSRQVRRYWNAIEYKISKIYRILRRRWFCQLTAWCQNEDNQKWPKCDRISHLFFRKFFHVWKNTNETRRRKNNNQRIAFFFLSQDGLFFYRRGFSVFTTATGTSKSHRCFTSFIHTCELLSTYKCIRVAFRHRFAVETDGNSRFAQGK